MVAKCKNANTYSERYAPTQQRPLFMHRKYLLHLQRCLSSSFVLLCGKFRRQQLLLMLAGARCRDSPHSPCHFRECYPSWNERSIASTHPAQVDDVDVLHRNGQIWPKGKAQNYQSVNWEKYRGFYVLDSKRMEIHAKCACVCEWKTENPYTSMASVGGKFHRMSWMRAFRWFNATTSVR